MPETRTNEPSVLQRQATEAALRFVYPGISIPRQAQLTPELAAMAFLLARALDSTSRITYGFFSFYESLLGGIIGRSLTWTSVPEAAARAVKGALEDSAPQRNLLVSAFLRYKFPQRLVEKHIEDPETFPLPEVKIDRNDPLDRYVYKLN